MSHAIYLHSCVVLKKAWILAIGLMLLGACTHQTEQENKRRIESLEKSVLAEVKPELDNLKVTTKRLQERIGELYLARIEEREIALDCTKTEYQKLETNNGSLLVACQDATPYLDGFKLTLKVGNPAFLTYHGASLTLSWLKGKGANKAEPIPPPPPGFTVVPETIKSTINITKDLRPGHWNRVEVVVSPIKAEELRILMLSIRTNRISLLQ